MALPQGINFRLSAAYVTDGANEYGQVSLAMNYPTTTAQGNNVGWESIAGGALVDANRSKTVDVRLAGVQHNTHASTYRIDLPAAGNYNVRAAFGDATTDGFYAEAYLKDGATQVATLATRSLLAAGEFKDATDTLRATAATWVSSNAPLTQSFATTIMRVQIGGGATDTSYVVSHLYVEPAAAGPQTITIGTSSESDATLAAKVIKSVVAELSHATEVAHNVSISKAIHAVQPEESDASNAFVSLKTYPIGLSTEIDYPMQASMKRILPAELAGSLDVALAFESSITAHMGVANELVSAMSMSLNQYYIIATATESDDAMTMIIGATSRVKWGSSITISLFKDPIVIDMFNQPITIQ